jgi:hypothetical protein
MRKRLGSLGLPMRNAGARWRRGFVVALSCVSVLAAASSAVPSAHLADLRGAWRSGDGALVLFQPDRVVTFEKGELVIGTVVRRADDTWTVRRVGLLESWRLGRSGGTLRIQRSGKAVEYQALAAIPPQLDPKPLKVPPPMELPAARVAEIQKELGERLKRDQAAIKSDDPARTAAVIADNAAYLEKVVGEVGWIDVRRFGYQAAANAVVLAKHSHHLILYRDAVPAIEADFKHPGDDAAIYSIFYDELMIELGGKQRYGTQLETDGQGKPFVLPLEDRARVDEWRKDIGLDPLAKYLELASKYFYQGQEIRLPREDE